MSISPFQPNNFTSPSYEPGLIQQQLSECELNLRMYQSQFENMERERNELRHYVRMLNSQANGSFINGSHIGYIQQVQDLNAQLLEHARTIDELQQERDMLRAHVESDLDVFMYEAQVIIHDFLNPYYSNQIPPGDERKKLFLQRLQTIFGPGECNWNGHHQLEELVTDFPSFSSLTQALQHLYLLSPDVCILVNDWIALKLAELTQQLPPLPAALPRRFEAPVVDSDEKTLPVVPRSKRK